MLNRRLGNGGGARFTVLNFSISGHLVTDELLTYIIHGDRLRPEVVISFDGWNDLANGAVNDPYLVNEHLFTYRYQAEVEARDRNGMPDVPLTNSHTPMRAINAPDAVVNAYLHRVSQFAEIASRHGSVFLACLQPCAQSKAAMSARETHAVESLKRNNPDLYEIFDHHMALLLAKAGTRMEHEHAHAIDFHRGFAEYGADRTLFGDRVHLSPEGETVVADTIFARCENLFDSRRADMTMSS